MKNFFKKTILGISLFTLGIFSFSWIALADTKTSTEWERQVIAQQTEKNMSENIKQFHSFWQWLYAITWPLIMIAGKFMENDVIYWSFVWMDVLLWKIWNVMRTFANYIIWLILIFSIFTLFLWWKFEQFNPIKIIPQLVVSALLVNASWFILWACLDVSTILTYSVGMLPLNVSADELNIMEKKVPVFGIKFQNDKDPVVKVGVKYGWKIIPFCEMTTLTWWGQKVYLPKNALDSQCAFDYANEYRAVPKSWIKIPAWWIKPDPKTWEVKLPWATKIQTKTFWQILTKYPWMSSVLWTLFASIVDIWKLSSYSSWTSWWMITDLMFKTLFLFALIIPLFAFALIMIARAVALWMFIIISPIIFLFTPIKWLWSKLLWEKWSLKEMCCMVFLPVTVTFALSISFVFLSVLNFATLKTNFGIGWKWNEVYIQTDWNPDHKITIKYKDTGSDSAMSNLVWLFQNTMLWVIKLMFAIWFMWVLVFTALKSCKITSGIAMSIESFSKNMAKAAPILPIAWWQSIASLWQWLNALKSKLGSEQSNQYQNLENIFKEATWKGKEKENAKEITKASNENYNNASTTYSSGISKDIELTDPSTKSKKKTKVWDLTFWDLQRNPEAIKQVASALWVSEDFIKKLATDKANKSTKVSSKKADIEKEIKKAVVKKALDDALTKKITIAQLVEQDPTFKNKLQEVLGKKVSSTDIKALSKKLAVALQDVFNFSKDQILKLIDDNLINWDNNPQNKKELEEIEKLLK